MSSVPSSEECVFVLEASSLLVLQVCPDCERVLGVPAVRVVGRPFTQWVDPGFRTDLANALSVLARASAARQFVFLLGEVELVARSGIPGRLELTLRGRRSPGKPDPVSIPA